MTSAPFDSIDFPSGLLHEDRSPSGYSFSGYVLLEFKEAESDKFWGLIEDDGDYIAFWGRNGRRPQQSQRISTWEASQRLREKMGKGYEISKHPGKLKDAFAKAPEWFENIKDASGGFLALVEKSKIRLEVAASEKERASASKARKSFRL